MNTGQRGVLLTLEGTDGCGKSSQLPRIERWLRDRGFEVKVTREPGGTELAEKIRNMVLSMTMDGLTEALLIFAARRDHIKQVIEPELARGVVVLCDRFIDSTFAYQGSGRGFSWETLETLEGWVLEGLRPDVTFWFEVSGEEAARRRSAARAPDRFEMEDASFFAKVSEGYRRRVEAGGERFVRVDASQSELAVWGDLAKYMDGWMSQRG